MRFLLHTHDAWGIVTVGNFSSLVEAQQAFTVLCEDPWYRQDGGVKGSKVPDRISVFTALVTGRNALAGRSLR